VAARRRVHERAGVGAAVLPGTGVGAAAPEEHRAQGRIVHEEVVHVAGHGAAATVGRLLLPPLLLLQQVLVLQEQGLDAAPFDKVAGGEMCEGRVLLLLLQQE